MLSVGFTEPEGPRTPRAHQRSMRKRSTAKSTASVDLNKSLGAGSTASSASFVGSPKKSPVTMQLSGSVRLSPWRPHDAVECAVTVNSTEIEFRQKMSTSGRLVEYSGGGELRKVPLSHIDMVIPHEVVEGPGLTLRLVPPGSDAGSMVVLSDMRAAEHSALLKILRKLVVTQPHQ